ncbi:hypothetical protein SEA_LASTRESORT_40 [Gordonia phage LastResort]|uniref:hypothetical protein n=1 Tax=Gordonia phage Rosalind TaxID=1838077 RepID=UPI0007B6344C|nr:hypothetical protein BEN61_gp071 [Gordonia phage Rosalind]AXH47838.1 hypothetical protein SEA_LASTRESORT_40 [Gordonia phage LastResort]QDM56216.1 hypothetical protein SEA_REMO_40 [Gordonia phage ReMo]QLF84913.1 hypothetical protein SEA_EPSOCAMISIO_40 [Gordonia phage Epsocamisio]QZD98689.1 hypothetical protein SEA_LOOPER_41 [Gordonia phage Looper]WKW87353.1 hypothetical protein SEA_NEBULOSUS_40 [Gordonia phage Nebulosus]
MLMSSIDRLTVELDPRWPHHVLKVDDRVLGLAGEPEFTSGIFGTGKVTIPVYELPPPPTPKRRSVAKAYGLRKPQ